MRLGLTIFRKDLNGSMSMQTSLATMLKKVDVNTDLIGESFLKFVEESKKWQDGYRDDCDRWRAEIIVAIHQENRDLAGRISLKYGANEQHLLRKLIGRLRFEEMTDRQERIAEAYRETFQWIFSELESESLDVATSTWVSFPQWLQTDSSLYWITGKAGSGKSTLMKYIYQDTRTFEYLEQWSTGSRCVTAHSFFGTREQICRCPIKV